MDYSEYDNFLSDFDVDPSTFTVDIGGGSQPWSSYMQDSSFDLSNFDLYDPGSFDTTDLGGWNPTEILMAGTVPAGEFQSEQAPKTVAGIGTMPASLDAGPM